MKINKVIAIIIGVLGLVGMFFFPNPEENFLYYVAFVVIFVMLIFAVLKFGKSKKK